VPADEDATDRRTTTDWDARNYDRLAAPQEAWARKVLERLPLGGAETVLDAGCGSGRATKLLLDKLPEGRVIGVDGSPSMIQVASEAFAGDDRVTLITSDLLDLTPRLLRNTAGIPSVDAVFSNATFHWIRDHERLFSRLRSVIPPGGRLVAQCGGRGNVEALVRAIQAASAEEPFAAYVADYAPWTFYGPQETEERLRAAGFELPRCWLEEVSVVLPEDPRDFISASGLAAHRERMPEDLREPFTEAVLDSIRDSDELRYIRLNIDAS
jgi:trans-aconitate 2-methyltransferase